MTGRCRQQGLSLIELMIAMTIGSILILGITQIFITNQKTYLFQQSQVGNQENGRFTLAVLGQELSKAGYRSRPTTQFPASSNIVAGCTFTLGSAVAAISATSLCIQYQASNQADVTCQGTGLATADKAKIAIPYNQVNPIIVERIDLDSAKQTITCTTATATQQLVNGIADIHFEYGSGINRTVTSFSSTPAQTVGAVRYAALMQGGTSSIRDSSDVPKVLADWKARFGGSVSDNNKIYQVVQSTIMLRNQMP
jgi:type IV pilus assembly protein PilW